MVTAIALAALAGTPASADDGEAHGALQTTRGTTVVVEAGDDPVEIGRTRHVGTVELTLSGDELQLVNDLPFEDYVRGVAEMPGRWPAEALKAQAVAARTYAWYVMRQGTYDGYDICASTACQVFRGADPVLEETGGQRWRDAVDATAGEVLVTPDGEPVLARYFSTSGGRTYANEEVFPSSGPRDELVAIDDPYDEASPYHRWTARFSREQFDTLLSRGQTLSAAVPVADVQRVGAVDDPAGRVAVTGQDGTVVEVGAVELRDFLSRVAPDEYPEQFPQVRDDGLRPLPDAVPSGRFDVEVTDAEVILHGRGWGHGVGMGQYGARGRAEAGHDYLDILATYYNGARPTVAADLPERIRVGREISGDVSIRATGAARLEVDSEIVADPALGQFTVVREGDDLVVTPPDGHDEVLSVGRTRLATGVPEQHAAVAVEADVNKPVLLALEVVGPDGAVVRQRDLGAADAGAHVATWRFDDDDGESVPAGRYRVTIRATDADGAEGGTPLEVEVPGEGALSSVSAIFDDGGTGPTVAVVALLVAVGSAVVLLVSRRRRSM